MFNSALRKEAVLVVCPKPKCVDLARSNSCSTEHILCLPLQCSVQLSYCKGCLGFLQQPESLPCLCPGSPLCLVTGRVCVPKSRSEPAGKNHVPEGSSASCEVQSSCVAHQPPGDCLCSSRKEASSSTILRHVCASAGCFRVP